MTQTKYKLLRECALEMKWKVITAKKKNDEAPTVEKSKKDGGQKEGKGQNEISYAE